MRRQRQFRNRQKASALAEFAGALVLLIPVFIILAFATYELVYYLYLRTNVDACARIDCRWLAINYNTLVADGWGGQFGSGVGSYSTWINPNVRSALCVVNANQFTNGTIDALGNFQPTNPAVPAAGSPLGSGWVAVQVVYPGVGTGLPGWPNPPLYLFGVQLTPPGGVTITGVYACDIEP